MQHSRLRTHLIAQHMDCDVGGLGDFSGDDRVSAITSLCA